MRIPPFYCETGDLYGCFHRHRTCDYEKPINIESENMDDVLLLAMILLLVAVLIPGIGAVRNGSQSWIAFGPFSFQPAEFVKVALIGKLA